jgi:hypothetical protein
VNPFEVFADYVALKMHFSRWDYDYFLFRGQALNITPDTFKKRRDKYWFEKLSDLHSAHERILAHCCVNEHIWVKDIYQKPEIYFEWQARQDTLTRTFISEIKRLRKVFDSNFLFTPGMHPYLVREYLGGRISLETLTIISDLTDCVSYWSDNAGEDPIFELVIRRIMKYTKFLDYDLEKFREILIGSVEDT